MEIGQILTPSATMWDALRNGEWFVAQQKSAPLSDDFTPPTLVDGHLGPEGHFAFNHAVRSALHGERFSAHDHLVAKRHDVRRQILVQKTRLAHHVVDASRVELLETLAKFLERNREFVRRDVLALFDEAVEFHEACFFGLGAHVC